MDVVACSTGCVASVIININDTLVDRYQKKYLCEFVEEQ